MEHAKMKLAVVEMESGHTTVVNTDQITYLRHDVYGTAIHFSSGEHIICPGDVESLIGKLTSRQTAESVLIKAV
jgi:hypothetical protein